MTIDAPSEWAAYKRITRTATYGFLAALPLVVMYELLVVFANQGAVAQVRVGAEVWLKQLLALIGSTGVSALGAAVLVTGAAVFWIERKKHIPIRGRYFRWMILESAVYAVLTATIVSGLVGAILTAAPQGVQDGVPQGVPPCAAMGMLQGALPAIALQASGTGGLMLQLALSIGAGVYEELLFRVLLVGGLYLALRRLLPAGRMGGRAGAARSGVRRGARGGATAAYVAAALIGAFLFSLVHYLGPLGDPFAAGSFLFRFLFGLVMNVLFLLRGFGIAAWTHALYDVMVVLVMAG